MILDLAYTSKNLYISNQFRFRFTYLLLNLDITSLNTKSLRYPDYT